MRPAAILAISLLVSLVLTPLVRAECYRWRLYDWSSGDPLKIHRQPTPRLGGIAVAVSALASAPFALTGASGAASIMGLCLAGILIVFVGVADDVWGLSPWYRLVGQVLGVAVVTAVGDLVPTGPHSPLATISFWTFCLVIAMNAMNLLDGLDGLAAGVAAVAFAGFAALASLRGDSVSQGIAVAALGASLGFLLYNFNPASIFLGDGGSTFLGFLLGLLLAREISAASGAAAAFAPILVMALPLLDVSLAIGRRLARRRSIFIGDRNHCYDWLMRRGLTQRATASVCYGLGALGACAAVMIAR